MSPTCLRASPKDAEPNLRHITNGESPPRTFMGLTWGEPRWFWELTLLPVYLVLIIRAERLRRRMLHEVVGERLAPRLAASVSYRRRWLRHILMMLAFTLMVASLARPQFGFTERRTGAESGDIVFLMDTSRSMLANDTRPNRLERCKLAAQDLLQRVGGDFVGVVAVAGTTFVQAPLTNDHAAISDILRSLDTSVLPVGGTHFALGLRESMRLLEVRPKPSKAIVFFTDGEDLEGDPVAVAKELARKGVIIHAVAFGTPEGTVIPIPRQGGGTDFVRDPEGNIVRSRLDVEKLRAITSISGGMLVQPANDPGAIDRLWREGLSGISKTKTEGRVERVPNEYYQVPLAAAIVLLIAHSLIRERAGNRRSTPQPAAFPHA